jgi:glycosyltransferase 2 family protein
VTLALMALPRTRVLLRDVVWPRIRGIGPRLLDAGSHPIRLAYSIGSNLVLTAAYVVSLMAALWSLGLHPGILAIALAYLAGNAVGSAAPTPGGLLAVEAAMATTLHLFTGIGTADALLAVLIFRIATFWLPIPVGWFYYVRLSRRDVL